LISQSLAVTSNLIEQTFSSRQEQNQLLKCYLYFHPHNE